MGFLYVDGHVRAYHGKHALPKGYVTCRRLAMPAPPRPTTGSMTGQATRSL